MDLQKLKYFHTVAKLQHVTRAAEELHLSQPSLTQAIQALERELDVPLLKKQGRGVVLTEFGTHLQQRLDSLLPELDRLPQEMAQLKNKSRKTVKLNILAASSLIIDILVEYRRINPDAVFEFEQNALHRGCDLLITTNGLHSDRRKGCSKHFYKEEQIFLAVPKSSSYARRKTIRLEEVQNESFVLLSGSRLFGALCKQYCQTAGFTPKILFESDSPLAVQNIIATGAGIAFWPAYSWGAVKNEELVLLPISEPICQRDLTVELYDRIPRSLYAEDFYEYLIRRI
ncbi:MAG: LysR family transcriptional regulator [Clostridia bacterium]|nr:LysR family transcriptional regulator [Clostridia bacterium]